MKKRKFEKGGSVYESAKNFLREKGILDDTPALDEEIALARMRRGEASRSEIPGRGDAIPMVRETMPTSGSASRPAPVPRPRLSPEVVDAARRRYEAEQAEKKSPGPIAAAGARAQNIMRVGAEREPGPIAAAGARAQNIMRASSSRRPEEEATERRKPREERDETAPVLFDSGLKSGGVVSRKIDGIAQRGKTRGRIC